MLVIPLGDNVTKKIEIAISDESYAWLKEQLESGGALAPAERAAELLEQVITVLQKHSPSDYEKESEEERIAERLRALGYIE
jgi:hypothetical protein